jgi:hypothetical protein
MATSSVAADSIYPGVGHGFLRTRDVPAVADSAWGVIVPILRQELESRGN